MRRVYICVRARVRVWGGGGGEGGKREKKYGYLFSFCSPPTVPCPVETAAAVAMTTRDTRFSAGRKDLGKRRYELQSGPCSDRNSRVIGPGRPVLSLCLKRTGLQKKKKKLNILTADPSN